MGFATHLGPWLLGTVKWTTGTTAGTIQNTGCTQVGQSNSLSYTQTSATQMFVLPAGAQIINFHVDVSQAFNAATGNQITIQDSSGNSLATVGSASTTPLATGRATLTNTAAAAAEYVNVGATDLIIQAFFTGTGTAASTGACTITCTYLVRASNGGQDPTATQG